MKKSSAWAKAELKRRRTAKIKKNSAYGINGGIEKSHLSNIAVMSIYFLLVDLRVGIIQR
jgi:hypothetical protein